MLEHIKYRLFAWRTNLMFHVATRQTLQKEKNKMNLDFLKALLQSRKFWLAFIGVIGAVIVFAQGGIDAQALVDAIVTLAGIVIAGIAVEDAAAKFSK
jgi:hypothetical protein